jgi:hypothetical protein
VGRVAQVEPLRRRSVVLGDHHDHHGDLHGLGNSGSAD